MGLSYFNQATALLDLFVELTKLSILAIIKYSKLNFPQQVKMKCLSTSGTEKAKKYIFDIFDFLIF
jgi:hypothetical protein